MVVLIHIWYYVIFAAYKITVLEIIFKYSPFWIFLILSVAAGLSFLLYYKNKREDFPKKISRFLFVLRFLVLFTLGLYLLSPMIKSKVKEVKKPVFLFAIDNSQSIINNADSSYYINQFQKDIDGLRDKISNKYRVDNYTFGENISKNDKLTFSEKSTDISMAIQKLSRLYKYKNVGALILASDGIYNQGQTPSYVISGINFPIYTIALGDTTIRRDLVLSKVATNKLVFLGDRFPVEAKIKAKKSSGFSTEVSLFMDGKLVDTKSLKFHSDFEQQVVRFTPKAQKVGIRKLRIQIKTIDNEYNKANNLRTVFVEVANVKQKILITYSSPHPDIGAIARSLKTSDNFEIVEKPFQELTQTTDYNLVIYHNLPHTKQDMVRMKNLMAKSNVPYILIAGTQTDLFLFNQLKTGITITAKKFEPLEVQPLLNPNFEMFSISKDVQELLLNLPPVFSPFGKYSIADNVDVLLSQKIGNVSTAFPLVSFSNTLGNMHAVIMGEGIWRWWLYDYQINGDSKTMDEFFGKLVKLVSLKINKEKFAIDFKNIYTVMEDVEFSAVMHNSAFEAITEPDIKMTIIEIDKNKSYDYTFSKGSNSYNLNIGRLEAGEYSFRISTEFDKKSYSKTGSFVVEDVNTEQLNLEANHRVLYQLSRQTGGALFLPAHMQAIQSQLEKRNDLVNEEYVYLKYSDFIDIGWVLLIIVLLIGLEWFLRKYYGSY